MLSHYMQYIPQSFFLDQSQALSLHRLNLVVPVLPRPLRNQHVWSTAHCQAVVLEQRIAIALQVASHFAHTSLDGADLTNNLQRKDVYIVFICILVIK